MDDCTWTFSRAEQQLRIGRSPTTDGYTLEIVNDGTARSYFFADLESLSAFQNDMEAFLLRTGWSFVSFSPERRVGGDRRGWPRIDERRRWWTDGQHQEPDHASRNRRGRKPPRG